MLSQFYRAFLVREPARATAPEEDGARFLALPRTPAALLLLPLTVAHYVPVAGVRGLWVGPYLCGNRTVVFGK